MSPIGHLVTATSMSIAFMRINEVSWTDVYKFIFDLTLVDFGAVVVRQSHVVR